MITHKYLLLTVAVFISWSPASVAIQKEAGSKNHTIEFEKNKGQFNQQTAFIAQTQNYQFKLQHDGQAEILLHGEKNIDLNDRIIFDFFPQHAATEIRGISQTQHIVNYLMGDKKQWITQVGNFKQLKSTYSEAQVEMIFYENQKRLEYDFHLKPKVNPASISIEIKNADEISLDESGNMLVKKNQHLLKQLKPIAYQLDENGHKKNIAVTFLLTENNYGFEVGQYDDTKLLVIDPIIEYSTYTGGSGYDQSRAIAVDANDAIYQLSLTSSPGLSTPSAVQDNTSTIRRVNERILFCATCINTEVIRSEITGRGHSILITKFSADGKTKLFSTYLTSPTQTPIVGGNLNLKTSQSGEAVISISAINVDDLPLVNETNSYSADHINAYIAKLNSTGDGLVFSTYIKLGTDGLYGLIRAIDVDENGQIAIAGNVSSLQTGITDALEVNPIAGQSCVLNPAASDRFDGYLMLFNPSGEVSFASCLGGASSVVTSAIEEMREIKFGSDGKLYVVGRTAYNDLPIVNGFQNTPSTNLPDLYVAVINPLTSTIEQSSYYGPERNSSTFELDDIYDDFYNKNFIYPYDMFLDETNNMIIIGRTNINSFDSQNVFQTNLNYPSAFDPTKSDTYGTFADFFVMKINPTTGLDWFTYVGGSYEELPHMDADIDSSGNIYLYGMTTSTDYPLRNSMQQQATGVESAVISKISKNGGLAFSTYFGGSDQRRSNTPGGIAVNSQNKIILGGTSEMDDYPITVDGDSRSFGFDATLSVIHQSDLIDTDLDGIPDSVDDFPNDIAEWQNNDDDNTGNNADFDDDNDGTDDQQDRFPYDNSEQIDSDFDGVGDVLDFRPDSSVDVFDSDGDNQGDRLDDDADNDGYDDEIDDFMLNSNEYYDLDSDGVGNNTDSDDDGDGVPDHSDVSDVDADIPAFTFEQFNPRGETPISFLLPYGFNEFQGADKLWAIDSSQSYQGHYSLATLPITDNQSAGLTYQGFVKEGTVSFYYKVDSELNQDRLIFSIDGQQLLDVSGDVNWTQFSAPVTAGEHTLSWVYQKNNAISVGEDSAAIDNITGLLTEPTDVGAYVRLYDFSTAPPVLPAGETARHQFSLLNADGFHATEIMVSLNLGSAPDVQNTLVACIDVAGAALTDFCDNLPRSLGNTEQFLISLEPFGITRFFIESQISENELEVTFDISATVNNAVLDPNLIDNQDSVNYHIGIFGSGFE